MIRWTARLLCVAGILMMTAALVADARPRNKRQFVEAYPKSRGTRLDACVTCHTTAPALNPYGVALQKANLAFASIEKLDSDKDGKSNRVEIDALAFPGDAKDKPGARADSAAADSAKAPDSTKTKSGTTEAR